MRYFFKHIDNLPIQGREHLNITYIETSGLDLSDFLSNAVIHVETWHSNVGPDIGIDELPQSTYNYIIELFTVELAA